MGKVDTSDIPSNVRLYFQQKTLEQILSIRKIIHVDLDSERKQNNHRNAVFLQALMLGILHGRTQFALSLPVPHSFAMSPSYVRKKVAKEPKKFAAPKRDVIECIRKKANYVYKDPIPNTFERGQAFMMNATDFELEGTVDIVLTSPPYFAAHTYAWDNWLRLWFLGYDYKEVASKILHTNREDIYLEHSRKVLKTMYGLLKDDSRCFIVVGDVKGHKPTAYLIASLIEKSMAIGFRVYRIINDAIDQKHKYLYGDNSHTGIQKDRILELHKGNPPKPNSVIWAPSKQFRLQQLSN